MNPRKMKTVGISFVLSAALLVNGCQSDTDSAYSDNNNSLTVSESESFTGMLLGTVLEDLAGGMASTLGENIMGNLLILLGWGDPSNEEEQKTLDSIKEKLTAMNDELVQLENEFKDLMTALDVDYRTLEENVNWPADAIADISNYDRQLQLKAKEKGPGEGNLTDIRQFADNILDPSENGVQFDVNRIFLAFRGNETPILPNHIGKVLDTFKTYNDQNLKAGYVTLEQLTSSLLNSQVSGVNLIVESYKAKDNNQSAQIYYDDFVQNTLYNEVSNMDNSYSFITNTLNYVLKNAPLYGQFLPDQAQDVFTQAKFYTISVQEHNASKYGLHLYDIRTDDLPDLSDTLYVAKDRSTAYSCTSVRHKVSGRLYDSWDGGNVKPSDQYKVTEYDCGVVPNGTYSIYNSTDLNADSMGTVKVSQYNSNYQLDDSGDISYGFNFLSGRIDNHFQIDSSKWNRYAFDEDNYNSEIFGDGFWPIRLKAVHQDDESYVDEESKARVEIAGEFTFTGDQNNDQLTKMTVVCKASFELSAYAPFINAEGGGTAYAKVNMGVWDIDESRVVSGTTIELDSNNDQRDVITESHDEPHEFEFVPQPGHRYSVYLDMYSYQCCNDNYFAEVYLKSVDYVYVKFSK